MIPLEEARAVVVAACRRLPPERRAVGDVAGHVLASSVRATEAVPPFANSAMDGYALRAEDTAGGSARLRVVGRLMAGDAPTTAVGEGEAVRIMTGAAMPRGADAVCMVERTVVEDGGDTVVVEPVLAPGANVRGPGEDIATGDEVYGPGTVLGPVHLGVLSSIGVESVVVHPVPTVGVVSTGDELVGPGRPLAPGKIRDANRPALLARLRADGFGAVDLGMVGDDEPALADLLADAATRCDALVASGGVSVGDRDVVRAVLEKLGGPERHWMQVAVKPAKPFAFGTLGDRAVPVFGLPGNPVSALVSYELFVRPALRAMAGHTGLDRPCVVAVAEEDMARRPDGKLHLLRVALRRGPDGELRARRSGGQDSHMLRAMADAAGLALVPDGPGVRSGSPVEVLLLDADRVEPLRA